MTYKDMKTGEFGFGFSGLVKNSEVLGFKTENKNKLKCKIELLEVLGHYRSLRVPRVLSSCWGG